VLYGDSAGRPSALLGSTPALTFSSTQPGGWYELAFGTAVPVTPGRYWIGLLSGRSNGVAGFRWTSSASCRAWNNDTYDDGPSDPFGTATVDAELMSMYATWVP
jgi:hypothetical protein